MNGFAAARRWQWLCRMLGCIVAINLMSSGVLAETAQVWMTTAPNGTWLGTANETRSMTYNAATGHLLVASTTPEIKILNASTGSALGNMSVTGVSSGAIWLTKIRDANGHIYACNLSSDINASSLIIYRWDTEAATPVVVYRNRASGGTAETSPVGPALPSTGGASVRVGDTMDIALNGSNVEVYLGATVSTASNQTIAYKIVCPDSGGAASAAASVTFAGATGAQRGVCAETGGGNLYWFTSGQAARYSNAGGSQTLLPSAIPAGAADPRFAVVSGRSFVAYVNPVLSGSPLRGHANVAIAEVAPSNGGGPASASLIDVTPMLYTPNTNSYWAGDCDFDPATGRVFALVTNNFVGAFTIPMSTSTKKWDGGGGNTDWNTDANWSPDGVPNGDDNVVLDNTYVSGAYSVRINRRFTQACRTLTVGDATTMNAIKLSFYQTGNGPAAADFKGAGLNDITAGGVFTQPARATDLMSPYFRVAIDGTGTPNTFKWNGANSTDTWTSLGVAITGGAQQLCNGITVTFASTSGHTLGDAWTFCVNAAHEALIVAGDQNNFTPDLVVRNGGTIENRSSAGDGFVINNLSGGNTARVEAGGTLIHATDASFVTAFPATGNGALSLDAAGTLVFDVFKGFSVPASGRTFGNLLLRNSNAVASTDCTYSATCSSGCGVCTINGALTVESNCHHTNSLSGSSLTIRGAITNNGNGTLVLSNVVPEGVTLDGDVTVSGSGAVQLAHGFTVPAGRKLTLGRSVNIGGTASVSGTLDCGAYSIADYGQPFSVNVASGGTLLLGKAAGVNGCVNSAMVTVMIDPGANLVFDGSMLQDTGTLCPPCVVSLTVNNASGVRISQALQVSSQLALASGNVKTDGSVLTVGSSPASPGAITGGGFVDGALRRYIPATASATSFPISAGSTDRSVIVDYAAGAPTSSGSVTASFRASNPGGDPLSLTDGGLALVNVANDGYWTLTSGDGLSGGTHSLSLQAGGFAALGNTATLRVVRRADAVSPWTCSGLAGTNAGTRIVRTGLTSFSQYAIAGTAAQVPVTMSGLQIE